MDSSFGNLRNVAYGSKRGTAMVAIRVRFHSSLLYTHTHIYIIIAHMIIIVIITIILITIMILVLILIIHHYSKYDSDVCSKSFSVPGAEQTSEVVVRSALGLYSE